MLTRLLPDQVPVYWDAIKYGIVKSVSREKVLTTEDLNNILKNILSGVADAWIAWGDLEGERKLYGVLVTYASFDPCSDLKNLVIYSIYGYAVAPMELWQDGMETLKKFGKKLGCKNLIGYTSAELLEKRMKVLGFEETSRILSCKIN